MERLVQQSDLEKYPHLISQGVSVNMTYDFEALESSTTEVTAEAPAEVASVEKEEKILEKAKPKPQVKATKTTQAKTPTKQKAKSK